MGTKDVDEIYESEHDENSMIVWLLRIVGIFIVIGGLNGIFGFLETILKVVPFIANIFGWGRRRGMHNHRCGMVAYYHCAGMALLSSGYRYYIAGYCGFPCLGVCLQGKGQIEGGSGHGKEQGGRGKSRTR